jgi:hypothetical protein
VGVRRILPSLATAGLLLSLLAGCQSPGGPDAVRPHPLPSSSPTATGLPTLPPNLPTGRPTATPGPSFVDAYAVSCAGYPTAEQVVAVLRRAGNLLPAGATVTVQSPPQCSGEWQFTVVSVPDREPLQVVTKGPPTALQLITAGTDVCSIPVRTQAPQGIRTLARCAAA